MHCFFEQSGTFKNEFLKLGIHAEDYDIQDNFNETDHVIDLFSEIDNAYDGRPSVFDKIGKDDLIIAFYPCIYFSAMSQMAFSLGYTNYRKLEFDEKIKKILERSACRNEFYERLIKFVAVCVSRGLRLIIENPWAMQTYLKANFLKPPDLIDENRLLRGDYFMKPTAYWFWNCEPSHGQTFQKDKEPKKIIDTRGSKQAGICSEDRSMISPDYARNFIHDFILGTPQSGSQLSLFDVAEIKFDEVSE